MSTPTSMRWFYVLLVFALSTLLMASASTAVLYIFGSKIETWLTPHPSPPSATKYSCQPTGICQVSEDGSFTSLKECTHHCDHAQCIIIGANAQCIPTPGNINSPSVSECLETCGQATPLAYVCDTAQGCRLASSTETGIYVDSTCNNMCQGYDMSSNGLCELVPLNGGIPKYDGPDSCKNENYTWSCVDYTPSNESGAPICAMDEGIVSGHSTSLSDCLGVCNPELYPICPSIPNGMYYALMDQRIFESCENLQAGSSCMYYGDKWEAKCTYCSRTVGMSNLYCALQ
jgi:hypothetical protein